MLVVCRPAATTLVRSQRELLPIRQPPEPQHIRSLRRLGLLSPRIRSISSGVLPTTHFSCVTYPPMTPAATHASGTGHSSGPRRHFTAAICFNRRSSNSILTAYSRASFFRYRSQAHVTTGRDQAQSRAESAYSTAHLHRRPAHSDPATTSVSRKLPPNPVSIPTPTHQLSPSQPLCSPDIRTTSSTSLSESSPTMPHAALHQLCVNRRTSRTEKTILLPAKPLTTAPSGLRQAEYRLSSVRRARLTFSRISEALVVQMKGLGLWLCLSMYSPIAIINSSAW